MECKVAIQAIHLYLDGELDIDQFKQLEAHMNNCAGCKQQYEQLEKTDAMTQFAMHAPVMNTARSERDIADLKSAILSQLPTKKQTRSNARFIRWLYRYPGLTAAAMFIVVMFISVFASWDQDNKLVISGSQEDLQYIVINGNTVIIPEGSQLTGDLVVENGIVEVKGAVDGNVTVIDGKMVLASTGHIAGQSKIIDQALDWIWYKVTSSIFEAIPQ